MPESAQFDWATFNIPDFANAPEGFGTKMRGLYVLGNVMGIVPKNDADHDARVLDFYLYWYSQAGAQMCYEGDALQRQLCAGSVHDQRRRPQDRADGKS